MIVDTHIHLDMKQYNKDLEEVINRAKNNGVNKFIIPAVSSLKIEKIKYICEKYDNVYFASGNHPNYTDSYNKENIEKYINHEKCVAIGECGLDWFRIPEGANIKDVKNKQIELFEEQIKMSIKYKKPLILHSRDTDEDMFNTLIKYKNDLIGGVIHCYVGSDKLLELEKYGFYYGIGGVLTYKSAKELRENVKKIPLNKLLLETDGPYLTPIPHRGKRNEPGYTVHILKELSNILDIEEKELEDICYENTKRLFNLN